MNAECALEADKRTGQDKHTGIGKLQRLILPYAAGVEVLQPVNFVMAQRQSTPGCIQRSWPMCEILNTHTHTGLTECWWIWTRSFKKFDARSTIWLPDLTTTVLPVLGQLWLDKPNISRRLPLTLTRGTLVMKHPTHLGFAWLCSIGV